MAINNTLTPIVPQIFAQGLSALRNLCVMPRLINNSYNANASEKGQVITIPVPSDIQTTDVVPGPYAPDSGNLTPTSAQITLNNWKEAAFTLSEAEYAMIVNGYVPRQVTSAIEALSNDVNASIFACYKKIGNAVGTAGTHPFATSVNEAVDAKEALTLLKTPPGSRNLVLDTNAMGNALKLGAFAYVLNSNDANVMREGEIGRKYGFNWYEDQQVPRHVAGTITTGLAAKSATAVAKGASQFTATTAASTGACALKIGDVIAIAGHSRTYTLTAAATQAAAASDVILNIASPLQFALTGGEAITVKGNHTVNLAFHSDCFGFASRTLAPDPAAAPNPYSMDVADPVSGLTLRLQVREEYHRVRWAFDILWGVDVVRESLGLRVMGA